MVYWWVGNWAKNWYRESQIFKVGRHIHVQFWWEYPPRISMGCSKKRKVFLPFLFLEIHKTVTGNWGVTQTFKHTVIISTSRSTYTNTVYRTNLGSGICLYSLYMWHERFIQVFLPLYFLQTLKLWQEIEASDQWHWKWHWFFPQHWNHHSPSRHTPQFERLVSLPQYWQFGNSTVHCYNWIQHEKCIKISTNKPSIGSVVLVIALEYLRKL